MKPPSTLRTPAAQEALQARVAARLTRGLDGSPLPAGVGERLRFARERALLVQRRPLAAVLAVGNKGALALGAGPASWWQRLASMAPIVLLAAGLLLIEQWNREGQIAAAVDVDAAILIDELPPAAYSDPGFAEFLKSSRP